MQYIIDTHTFIWFSGSNPSLSERAKTIIENPENEIYISIASLWEISIKNSLGKLDLKIPYAEMVAKLELSDFVILPITAKDTIVVNEMPWRHKDPFDRVIIAQSIVYNMPVISADVVFDAYEKLVRIW
jgi:PIN domain nuclease of toxin-antitoxin system